ncbi:hypothetical protein TCAL_11006 [Tigriopus californicus]|uniref:Sodium/potassium-transporting ATPase subunit beta n=1 Tax=Tigriopus californicus TaxID=6832 RepID=A0A553PPS8_TIGCA|nr:hypothetical protein TCAL_11006 [Tigriopus californicus]
MPDWLPSHTYMFHTCAILSLRVIDNLPRSSLNNRGLWCWWLGRNCCAMSVLSEINDLLHPLTKDKVVSVKDWNSNHDKGADLQSESSKSSSPLSSSSTSSSYVSSKKLLEKGRVWVSLGVYQLIYISLITSFFSVYLVIVMHFMDPFQPRIRRGALAQPGMGFRPRPTNPYSTLIHFQHGTNGNWKPYKNSLNDFTKKYGGFGKEVGPSIVCNWNTQLDQVSRCHVPFRKYWNPAFDYSCVKVTNNTYALCQMNQIVGWEPNPYYNITEINGIPEMPKYLKQRISKLWNKNCKGKGLEMEQHCPNLRMTWVSCQGTTSADQEYMGPLNFHPAYGMQGYYYPYHNQEHFLSPFVWLQFRGLTPGVIVSVECKLWAKNIKHDPLNPRIGGVRFEILMD